MERKVIYVYKKNYREEEGFIKIGDASIDRPDANLEDNSAYLKEIAEKRIRNYEHSSPITILYTTSAVDKNWAGFRDYQVHNVLERSGIPKMTKGKSTEWFKTDLAHAKAAINAVKQGKTSLQGDESIETSTEKSSIIFRPEQEEAISQTIKIFNRKNDMLWNAKMRFGKTLCALEVVKRKNFKKTLIFTHRPIVDEGWYEDFKKIFHTKGYATYQYGSKKQGERVDRLLDPAFEHPFVYFASLQDLRSSSLVNAEKGFDKNEELFKVDWDFLIIDEAHEGTQSPLAESVIKELRKEHTKVLKLSGTPFNLMEEYDENQIFTWDYVMEQEAKTNWDQLHAGDTNPYATLPEMQMFVYELSNYIKNNDFVDIENKAFNFSEFFKTDESGKFLYEKEVWSFLNLISRSEDYSSDQTNMPFSTQKYRAELRHTLWTLPNRSSAVALERLLKKHPVFQSYNIANLVEDGNTIPDLQKISAAITNEAESNYSITLTVRKGTVGTTVKEWTGILVLNNTESASNYLQSIFRVQTPYSGKNGQKEKAYVFDFAPDRTLKMMAEAARLNTKGGSLNTSIQKEEMKKFLNFLPIISVDGNRMKEYSVNSMLTQLKRAQAERAVRTGFDDTSIYSEELLRLSENDLKEFEHLRGIVGKTKQTKPTNKIDINKQGMSDEEWERAKKGAKKKKKDRTPEEIEAMEKRKQLSKQKKTMISILRGISIRIPLMIYGMNLELDDDVTIDNFANIIDDVSWNEFMPKGITKEEFNRFKKYYDPEIFIEAGRRIRRTALAADKLSFEDRIDKISSIFSGFKNPDKETVLTPWRVVNMQLGETFGGYNFFDEGYPEKPNENKAIRYINRGEITEKSFSRDTRVLEINSKTGLYPLYMAYSIYKKRYNSESVNWVKKEWIASDKKLWQEVLENNIFVLSKTPMARTISYRTLNGYEKNEKVSKNIVYVEELTNKLKNNLEQAKSEVLQKFGGEDMKFDVVVGNPPYQEDTKGKVTSNGQKRVNNVFQYFQELADLIAIDASSLIYPAGRWIHRFGKGVEQFGLKQINDPKLCKLTFYKNSEELFKGIAIGDGVSLVMKDYHKKSHNFLYEYVDYDQYYTAVINSPGKKTLILNPKDNEIANKIEKIVKEENLKFLSESIFSQKLFHIESDFVEKNPSQAIPYHGEKFDSNKFVKLFSNDKAGKAGRAKWFLTKRKLIPVNVHLIDEYQVVVSSANAGGQKRDNQISIIDNKSAFGRSRVALKSFNSLKEAENFFEYANSDLIKFAFLLTDEALTSLAKKVPDLLDYSNDNGLINFSKDINSQLSQLFHLTKQDEIYIKERIPKRNL